MLFFGNPKVFECLHFEILTSAFFKPVDTDTLGSCFNGPVISRGSLQLAMYEYFSRKWQMPNTNNNYILCITLSPINAIFANMRH